jgi:hypothetical protein
MRAKRGYERYVEKINKEIVLVSLLLQTEVDDGA